MTENRFKDREPFVPADNPGDSARDGSTPQTDPSLEAAEPVAEAAFDDSVIATPAQFGRFREEKGWTVGEVAARMRMQARQIEAIEAGRWQDLPGTAFVRAAIRSYARLLGRDPAPLLASVAQLDTGLDLRSTNRAPVAISPTGSIGESSGIGRWGLALLGLLAVIAIAFYFAPGADLRWPSQWFEGEGGAVDASSTIATGTQRNDAGLARGPARTPPPPAPSPSDDAVAAAARAANELLGTRPDAGASSVDGASVQGGESLDAGRSVAADNGLAGVPAAGPAAGAMSGLAGAGAAATGSAAVAGTTESVPPEFLARANEATSPASAPAAPAAPPAAPAEAARASSLMMSFDAECWVEVTAAGNKRLVYGLQKPDTSLSLDAPGPLSILIGNADAVTLTRAGEPVDVKSAARDGVAKLRLE